MTYEGDDCVAAYICLLYFILLVSTSLVFQIYTEFLMIYIKD
jgi:hypothetical protein